MKLETLERLHRDASPAPWGEDDGSIFCRPISDARGAAVMAKIRGDKFDPHHLKLDAFVATTNQRHDNSDADAELIVELRNAVPALLALGRTVEKYLTGEGPVDVAADDILDAAMEVFKKP